MACVPEFFFGVSDQKNKLWGTQANYNQFLFPHFFFIKNTKKQNPGDTSHKKNQISLFEKSLINFLHLFACVLSSGQKTQSTAKNKADIGSFVKFASKLVSISFVLFSCFGYIFLEFSFFFFLT